MTDRTKYRKKPEKDKKVVEIPEEIKYNTQEEDGPLSLGTGRA